MRRCVMCEEAIPEGAVAAQIFYGGKADDGLACSECLALWQAAQERFRGLLEKATRTGTPGCSSEALLRRADVALDRSDKPGWETAMKAWFLKNLFSDDPEQAFCDLLFSAMTSTHLQGMIHSHQLLMAHAKKAKVGAKHVKKAAYELEQRIVRHKGRSA